VLSKQVCRKKNEHYIIAHAPLLITWNGAFFNQLYNSNKIIFFFRKDFNCVKEYNIMFFVIFVVAGGSIQCGEGV
jgi:hypothetical protein